MSDTTGETRRGRPRLPPGKQKSRNALHTYVETAFLEEIEAFAASRRIDLAELLRRSVRAYMDEETGEIEVRVRIDEGDADTIYRAAEVSGVSFERFVSNLLKSAITPR